MHLQILVKLNLYTMNGVIKPGSLELIVRQVNFVRLLSLPALVHTDNH